MQVAVLDIDAALAVHDVQGLLVDADALVGFQVDLRGFLTKAQHLGVDGLALQHDFGEAVVFVQCHLFHRGRKRGVLLAGHADFDAGNIVEPRGGIQVADGIKFPGKAGGDLPGAVGGGRRETVRQHLLQSGRVSVVQCLAIRRDGGRRRCAAEVAVRRGRDSLQSVELRFDAVIFNLQSRDGICKARRLAGADLQTVLRQQEGILGVGNAAVLRRVDLIQQVVQCLFCLVRQHRQIAAGGVLGLCQ